MELPRFTAQLQHHKAEIGETTYWRYKGGQIPRWLRWLVERPELAIALAEDAVQLAGEKGEDRTMVAQERG